MRAMSSKKKESPLYTCAKYSRGLKGAKMVAWLIEEGSEINFQNKLEKNMTPLHIATKWKNYDVAKVLLRRGANPNLKDSDGNTALSYCSPEDIDAIATALEHGEADKSEMVDPGIIAKTLNLCITWLFSLKAFSGNLGKLIKSW